MRDHLRLKSNCYFFFFDETGFLFLLKPGIGTGWEFFSGIETGMKIQSRVTL